MMVLAIATQWCDMNDRMQTLRSIRKQRQTDTKPCKGDIISIVTIIHYSALTGLRIVE